MNVVDEGITLDFTNAKKMWEQYVETMGISDCGADIEYWGDSVQLADELVQAVIKGQKRATASLMIEYSEEGIKTPAIGQYTVLCDGAGAPQVIVQTIELRLSSFFEVSSQHAYEEGEGERTLEYWRVGHEDFWRRVRQAAGATWSPGQTLNPGHEIVLERFAVVWPPEHADRRGPLLNEPTLV